MLLVGLCLRWLEPTRLVMIYSAYEWTDQVARFTGIGRYGASTSVLYRLLFSLVPPDHEHIVALHRVAGALTLAVMAGLLARCKPPAGAVALFAAWAALLPLSVRDHATESILVPIILWLSAGLLLLDKALQEGPPLAAAVGSLVLLALAMTGRPEMLGVVPAAAALLILARRGAAGWRWLLWGGAALAVLGLPHGVHVRSEQIKMATQTALAPLDHSYWAMLLDRGLSAHIAWHPELLPAAVPALALVSLRHRAGRKVRLAVWVLSLLWVAVLVVDLPNTSIARLQAPLGLALVALAAWAVAAEMQSQRPGLWLAGSSTALILTAVPTHQHLRSWTNEDQAEQVWRRSLAQLPPRGACLVALTPRDRPEPGKVQRAVPAYLLRPPHSEVQLLSVNAWLDSPPPCPGGAFLLVDPRCYAIYRRPAGLAPLLPGCAAALQHAQPVDAWTLPNLGDNEYGYYADVKEFQVGLYRLQPRR